MHPNEWHGEASRKLERKSSPRRKTETQITLHLRRWSTTLMSCTLIAHPLIFLWLWLGKGPKLDTFCQITSDVKSCLSTCTCDFFADFDNEATWKATTSVTPSRNATDAEDNQSVLSLCGASPAFNNSIKNLQQKPAIAVLHCPVSAWTNKQRQQFLSLRVNLLSGVINKDAIKATGSEDQGSLEIIMPSSPFVSGVAVMK